MSCGSGGGIGVGVGGKSGSHERKSASSSASAKQHYSTFTNDIQQQQQRLAALQPEPVKEPSVLETFTSSVSASVANFFRTMVYRLGMACLPCFELAAALNLLPLRSSSSSSKNVPPSASDSLPQAEEGRTVTKKRVRHPGRGRSRDDDSVTLLSEAGSVNSAGAATNGHCSSKARSLAGCTMLSTCLCIRLATLLCVK